MGFLQRGFAWGNRRGFAAKQPMPEMVVRLITFINTLLGGGGKIADQTATMLTIPQVLLGHGSYPDSIGLELTADLIDMLNTTQGGGGKTTDQTATMLTTPVVLSLGSYP